VRELKAQYPKAQVLNAKDVRTIYLIIDDSVRYHKFAKGQGPAGMTRIMAMNKLISPLMRMAGLKG
jgi:hypothetical protein